MGVRLDGVNGYSGTLAIEPGVVRLRVQGPLAALRGRPLGAPLVHPGPDITLVRLRWELQPGHRAALLLHKPATRAYIPLTPPAQRAWPPTSGRPASTCAR